MASIPQIQIRQVYAKIGINTTTAKQEIKQPKATIEIHQVPAKLEIEHSYPQVEIDQRKARGALGFVPYLDFMNRIHEGIKLSFLNNLAQMAEKGDRLTAIDQPGNSIADLATFERIELPELDYLDTPSYDNVEINVKPARLNINWIKGGADLQVQPNKPELNYTPGKVNIYLLQRNSLEISLPKINQRI